MIKQYRKHIETHRKHIDNNRYAYIRIDLHIKKFSAYIYIYIIKNLKIPKISKKT